MFNIKSLARMAICTALIVVCSWLTVPFTVPFTMQTFAIFFTVCLLGPWQGMISTEKTRPFPGMPCTAGYWPLRD